ncbi:MAG: AhpC/TSA family protein [Bacteroidaceae bacterium]|nr:AhpC/TSA family protein [Bacteroidaceae bacterium]MBQ9177325.1 AhpC/TSA family protein [Bacteroidaceae bacterium]
MQTRNILSLLLSAGILLTGCDRGQQFHVSGSISEAADSTLYLEAITLDGIVRLDSTRLKADGLFSFKADAPSNPEFYALRIGSHRIHFSIDSTESVVFSASLPTMSTNYTVEGSDNCQKIKEISLEQSRLQSQIIALERSSGMYPGDVVDSINRLIAAYKEHMAIDYIVKEPMKAYAYYAVCQSISDLGGSYQVFNPLTDRNDVKCYAAVATAWDGLYPDAERTIQLCNMTIKGMSNTTPPTQRVIEIADSLVQEASLIDVKLPDISGNIRTLTELKGQVVMLDFTVYGAQESPERTRHMRELYDRFHAQGFEIYQVSLDADMHYWKTACEHLPWICVHEQNGTASNMYRVANLPTFFLINRDNEVVLRSSMIKTTVEEEIRKLL